MIELSRIRPQISVSSQRTHLGLSLSLAKYFLVVPIDLNVDLLDVSTLIFFSKTLKIIHKLTKSLQSGMQHQNISKNEPAEIMCQTRQVNHYNMCILVHSLNRLTLVVFQSHGLNEW